MPSAASAVNWAVIVNNVAALEILMDCGYGRALTLVVLGAVARAAVGWCILSAVGLQGRNWGDVGVGMISEGFVDTLQWLGSWG